MEEISWLVAKARKPDGSEAEKNAAFDEIVRRFQDMAYGCAYAILGERHLAQDAAQEAFLAAWRSLHQLERPEAFPAWFKRVLVSQCHRLTRGKHLGTVALDSVCNVPAPALPPDATAEQKEVRSCVTSAIEALPEGERVVATLFYGSDQSYTEIAEFLGLPVSTIKKRLHSARRRLRDRLMDLVQDALRERRPSRDERFRGRVQFFNSLRGGDVATVGRLLRNDPELLRHACRGEFGSHGHPPLAVAALYGHRELVELLLASGADVHQGDPLYQAAFRGYREIAAVLVAAGATDSLLPPSEAAADLLKRAHSGAISQVAALLDGDPTLVSARDGRGRTALHIAATYGYEDLARLLVERGADVESTDDGGQTPLGSAAANANWCGAGQADVVRLLASGGARCDVFTACRAGAIEVIEALLNCDPELINATDANGSTPLEYALWGYPDNISAVVRFLFIWSPTLNIFTAARFGHLECVAELLEENPSLVHATDGLIGWTPLHFAAQNWCPPAQGAAVAELLIARGAEVNSRGKGNAHWTPLHAAAEWWDDVQIAAVLLNHGADINARTDSGWTPLGYALEKCRGPMAEFLRERGGKE